ncbi:MAG TPA: HAD-IA family hydrolase [Thermoanaerobaculia bacterium]|nr:HAD-IA family hydrolase [Thermoanaerobaculia bacterium]
MPRRFDLIVFDWDGTLMDSLATIVACSRAVMRELELGDLLEPDIRRTIGLGLRESMELLVPGCDDALYARILQSYRKHWLASYRDEPVLFEGVAGMLRELAGDGYLLAVATGKGRRGLDHDLAQTCLTGVFHATRTVDEAFSKPHPKMLLDILDELGVKPGRAVMIGDTVYDLEMARSAGTAAVGVCSGSHCREDLERLQPVACLETVVQLREWLGSPTASASPPATSPAP